MASTEPPVLIFCSCYDVIRLYLPHWEERGREETRRQLFLPRNSRSAPSRGAYAVLFTVHQQRRSGNAPDLAGAQSKSMQKPSASHASRSPTMLAALFGPPIEQALWTGQAIIAYFLIERGPHGMAETSRRAKRNGVRWRPLVSGRD